MAVISDLMKRLGWVRASEDDLDMASSAGTSSSFNFIPEAPSDPASCFDPSLSRRPSATAPPPVLNSAVPQAPQAAPVQAPQAAAPVQAVAAPEVAPKVTEEDEEDWDALMEAARLRAEGEAPSAEQVIATARERAKSEPPFVPEVAPIFALPPPQETPNDAASAQVERGSVAANDDRPAVQLSAIPATPAQLPAIALTAPSESPNEDEEYLRLRAAVDAKENSELERKLRAMREIRRLRGKRGNTGQVPSTAPPKRRLAAGTVQPPIDATEVKAERSALIMAPGPVKAPPAKAAVATPRSLPRITQRLKGSS